MHEGSGRNERCAITFFKRAVAVHAATFSRDLGPISNHNSETWYATVGVVMATASPIVVAIVVVVVVVVAAIIVVVIVAVVVVYNSL